MKPTSSSSENSPTQEFGAIDSLWQPSWWHWLISALSGTIETEKETALLKKLNLEYDKRILLRQKSNEELRKSNEELRKSNEEERIAHEQRMNELRQKNRRLAEIESKLNEILRS